MSENGRKSRGGQRGNLNAARSILPALRRLHQGKPLPPNLARVAALADQEAELLISDKGGLDNMTGGERLMLNVWRTARQATLLILGELVERGAITVEDGRWDLQPGAARLAKFLAEERAALVALRFDERRAKDATPSLAEIRRQFEVDQPEGADAAGEGAP